MDLRFYGSKQLSLYTGILSCIIGGFAFGFGISGLTPLQLFTDFLLHWNLKTEYDHIMQTSELYWLLIILGTALVIIGLFSMRHATKRSDPSVLPLI
jgi:hypothetical protein